MPAFCSQPPMVEHGGSFFGVGLVELKAKGVLDLDARKRAVWC
jgi:hypothetical protein